MHIQPFSTIIGVQTSDRPVSSLFIEAGRRIGEIMGSRDKDSTTHHQPLLSSLVVRPSNSDGGGGGIGGTSGGRIGRGSDYEAGEIARDPPQYSRLNRYSDDLGSLLFYSIPSFLNAFRAIFG